MNLPRSWRRVTAEVLFLVAVPGVAALATMFGFLAADAAIRNAHGGGDTAIAFARSPDATVLVSSFIHCSSPTKEFASWKPSRSIKTSSQRSPCAPSPISLPAIPG